MAEKRQFESFLLKYVPNILRDESVNVGVVLIASDGSFADVRFTRDWSRVLCADGQADTEMLAALERDIRARLQDAPDRAALMHMLEDSCSNVVQLSPIKAGLAEDAVRELEMQFQYYVQTHVLAGERVPGPRRAIVLHLEDAFRKAGVLDLLLRNVSMAPYTRPGDPMRFDFGYGSGENFRLLHAVSLKTNVDSAMILAARFPEIAVAIRQRKQAQAWLTAVVDDDLDMSRQQIGFALGMMKESGIRVAEARQVAGIAEEIRVELGV
jgi:hypothetical protein